QREQSNKSPDIDVRYRRMVSSPSLRIRFMFEGQGRNPIFTAVLVLGLVGGGWYFFQHFRIEGLDHLQIHSKQNDSLALTDDRMLQSPSIDANTSLDSITLRPGERPSPLTPSPGNATGSTKTAPSNDPMLSALRLPEAVNPSNRVSAKLAIDPAPGRHAPLRIASWAMGGLTPSKLSNDVARRYLVRLIQQFDLVAIQQVSSIERDLVPRLIDHLNSSVVHQGDLNRRRYDYVMGPSDGPKDRQEQLAILFDTSRIVVDRTQTYTLADPAQQMTHDPLVAWFRAAQPDPSRAFTFTVVNLRLDLTHAAREVAILKSMIHSVVHDGRGEDDVILAGLLQADDTYLLPTLASEAMQVAVRSTATDIFNRHQTSNLVVDSRPTREYLGRGGVYNFLRIHNLSNAEAEMISPHLPVFGEFTATESIVGE
ncbi:MAG: deoxyribonuclease I, partial [Planctomycetota bacterium]